MEARPWLGDACGVEARPMWCGTPRYSSTALYGAILSCCRRTTAELRPLLNGAACACGGGARCSAAICNFQQRPASSGRKFSGHCAKIFPKRLGAQQEFEFCEGRDSRPILPL